MKSITRQAGMLLMSQAEELAEEVTARQYSRQPDLTARFGASGRIRTRQDSVYNLQYLAESVLVDSPSLFVHYIAWLKTLLDGYQVSVEELRVNLQCMEEVIQAHVKEPERGTLLDYLRLGRQQLTAAETPSSFLKEDQPLAEETKLYLQALLNGDRRSASQLITRLVEDKVPLRDLYLYIFQTTQHEIGRLWQTNRIQVAQEHFCTAATQMIMSQLYPYLFTSPRKSYTLVSACVGKEMHEVGLRVLTDLFELEGWDTYYLGANVPARSVIHSLIHHKADVIAISATMTYHVHLVEELISQIRGNPECAGVRIIVGGLPFNIDSKLWKRVGADGWASDAEEAVRVAEGLLQGQTAQTE
ncbi:cobalamin-dependent protein [Paenibacillus aurantius]|uniref:Cobalamin-dependent protein n=1 Tax=Paenibacillus aurantius TaxID=2918900 RepID=A0AA96LAJ1_9BACL|nr:cobalamin-dependent protein [Paenibacillus aurantius]WNQ10086.1 cobalamin-dependent protein [Paenibacillus aurantius]